MDFIRRYTVGEQKPQPCPLEAHGWGLAASSLARVKLGTLINTMRCLAGNMDLLGGNGRYAGMAQTTHLGAASTRWGLSERKARLTGSGRWLQEQG